MKISKDLINNNVPAEGQIEDSDCVSFTLKENADLKILFLGNSITRHGIAESLGWYGDWGMAASSKQNDYVHRLVSMLEAEGRRVAYCLANLSEWERLGDMSLLETRYAAARAFNADLVIVRLGENAQLAARLEDFVPKYSKMVKHFAADGARVVLTDLFWEYSPFDSFVKSLAEENGYMLAQLHDLGSDDKMKATGKFSHAGVASHPSDNGIAAIAQRIFCALKRNGGV